MSLLPSSLYLVSMMVLDVSPLSDLSISAAVGICFDMVADVLIIRQDSSYPFDPGSYSWPVMVECS